jgi:hypothetical protein
MSRLPLVDAPCGHRSYVRKHGRTCTFCEWADPSKRARYRYGDIVKGARAGTRWPVQLTLGEFQSWYCQEASIRDACHYCGIDRPQLRDAGSNLCSWHIDRKNNSLPYVLGNLVLACDHCNSWKGARRTYAETVAHGAAIWRGELRE